MRGRDPSSVQLHIHYQACVCFVHDTHTSLANLAFACIYMSYQSRICNPIDKDYNGQKGFVRDRAHSLSCAAFARDYKVLEVCPNMSVLPACAPPQVHTHAHERCVHSLAQLNCDLLSRDESVEKGGQYGARQDLSMQMRQATFIDCMWGDECKVECNAAAGRGRGKSNKERTSYGRMMMNDVCKTTTVLLLILRASFLWQGSVKNGCVLAESGKIVC